jgi:hypothetical protein
VRFATLAPHVIESEQLPTSVAGQHRAFMINTWSRIMTNRGLARIVRFDV